MSGRSEAVLLASSATGERLGQVKSWEVTPEQIHRAGHGIVISGTRPVSEEHP